MNKLLLIGVAFSAQLVSVNTFAQKQYDNWFFGDFVEISFVSGAPVNVSGSALITNEGCSAMSDSAGNKLIYTDGYDVYNANNVAMPNGFGLMGNWSSTQSGLIVPDPGNGKGYYLFTVTDTGNANGFRYSYVDMTLDGGLGDVTTKNVPVLTPVDEKLTAIPRPSGGYWIVVHGLSNVSNSYYAYPLTGFGLGTPVISSVGTLSNSPTPWVGYMKISPDGTKIARAMYAYGVEIADFNMSTGVVSNPFIYNSGVGDNMYGIEFSQTGNFLYAGTTDNQLANLYQLNMRAGNQAAILASATLIYAPHNYGALQIGPDHKIYYARGGLFSLGVINYPDSLGTACHYVDTGFTTINRVELGLPNLITVPVVAPPVAGFQASKTVLCENDCINFTDLSAGATSWQWSFAGAIDSTSTSQNPQGVCYLTTGIYNVTLIAANSGGSDTLTLSSYISVNAAPPTPIITQHHDTLYCNTDPSYIGYQWYADTAIINGATDTLIIVSANGNYNLKVTNASGCKTAVGINVIITGIQNYMNDHVISLYPDPVNGKFMIYDLQFTTARLEIYNMLGQVCRQSEITNAKSEIDVSLFPSGIYFVQVINDNGRWTGRFVKE